MRDCRRSINSAGLVLTCLIGLLASGEAFSSDTERAQILTLSYVKHPIIEQEIIPLLEDAYAELDIQVKFIEQPSARNLLQASRGITDGDVAYSDLLVKRYPNLLKVEPGFLDSQFVLLCRASRLCSPDILRDADAVVVLTDATRDGMKAIFSDDLRARLYAINYLHMIPELIDGEKFDYGVYVTTTAGLGLQPFAKLQSVKLFKTRTHHILHEKHRELVPRISEAIKRAALRRQEAGHAVPLALVSPSGYFADKD